MVVQNSVTFYVTRIGNQVDRSKALNYIRSGQHLLVSSSTTGQHTSSVHHNWSLLKSDRFSLPASIMIGPLTLEVDHIGFATPTLRILSNLFRVHRGLSIPCPAAGPPYLA